MVSDGVRRRAELDSESDCAQDFCALQKTGREMEKLVLESLLMEHVKEFAKRIKLSGTPEELESFGYLEQRMQEYGYSTRLLSHDAYISLQISSRLVVDGNE